MMWSLLGLILTATCATALPWDRSAEECELLSLEARQTAGLPSSFQKSSSDVLVAPQDDGRGVQNVKDPSIVYYNGKYHVFASIYTTGYSKTPIKHETEKRLLSLRRLQHHHLRIELIMSFRNQRSLTSFPSDLVYFSFSDFDQANSATFTYLSDTNIGSGYRAAPQVFYFAPQKLFYLVFQNGNAAYSTNPETSDHNGRSAPKNFFSGTPAIIQQNIGNGNWVDIWVICDSSNCHLFSSDDNGHLYRAQTSVGDFPNVFDNTVIALEDSYPNKLFEASNV